MIPLYVWSAVFIVFPLVIVFYYAFTRDASSGLALSFESFARLGLVGYKAQVQFWEKSQELWLSGSSVLINGRDILSEIDEIKNRLN
jgi:ABC-type sugar transport system permease subunit